jgi:hypothetical protein
MTWRQGTLLTGDPSLSGVKTMASRVLLNKINPALPAPAQPVELKPHLALLAAVFQLAIRDAQRGRGQEQVAAVDFLMETAPDWVEQYALLA